MHHTLVLLFLVAPTVHVVSSCCAMLCCASPPDRHPNITTAYHFLTWNYAHDTGEIQTSGSLATRTPTEQSAAASMVPGVSAAAAGSSSLGPATPSLTRRNWGQAGRGIEVVTPSVAVGPQEQSQQPQQQQQHLSASGTSRAGLFVIQSQSMSSSALAAATGSSTAQQAFTGHTGAAGAGAASGAAHSWGHTNNSSSGSSIGSGALNSSSSGALAMSSSRRRGPQVEPMPLDGPLPLLPNQQATAGSLQPQQAPAAALSQATAASDAHSPGRGSAAASATAAAAARSPACSAVSSDLATAAPVVAAAVRNAGSQSEAGAASSAAYSGSPSGLAALAPGAASPDAGSTASWVPQRLMPLWDSRMASPGQGPSGWSLSAGTTTGAVGNSTQGIVGATLPSTRTDEQPTQDQQQPQLSQQPSGQQQQQEFVPMVPYRLVQHQQQNPDGQVQQQQFGQYMPLTQMQEEQGPQPQQSLMQKHVSDCSSATTLSQPQLLGQQLQQRQLPRAVQRFDAGSGGSSYFGSKAQSGEAQTWLILEFCDGGTLLDLMQEGLLFSTVSGLLNMVGAWMEPHIHLRLGCRRINLCAIVARVTCLLLGSVQQATSTKAELGWRPLHCDVGSICHLCFSATSCVVSMSCGCVPAACGCMSCDVGVCRRMC